MLFANDNALQTPTGQILIEYFFFFFFQFLYAERASLKLR